MYTESYTDPAPRGERVFTELKARLLAGEFALGRRLGEERLATALSVSRTPVREALHRLHSEGLVQRDAEGGFRPAVPDVVGMRTLYEVRIGLEIQALRRPASLGTEHDAPRLMELRAEWRALADDEPPATPEFVLLDEAFHVGLADAAGNPVLVEFLRVVNERIRVVRMQDFLTADRVEHTIAEHVEIVDAVLSGDCDLAVERFDAHLRESLAVVEERTLRALARMSNASADAVPLLEGP
ncbi:MAG TPA: GntR family transcriptional regulator [Acidimicrobiia bacterium]|nr:GntR family transcriptional regulator [Acidimicrobiia bacterium]